MDKLVQIGRDIELNGDPRHSVTFHGDVVIQCKKCGYSVRTFLVNVHNANTIICPNCGTPYKAYFPEVTLQKKLFKKACAWYKRVKREREVAAEKRRRKLQREDDKFYAAHPEIHRDDGQQEEY